MYQTFAPNNGSLGFVLADGDHALSRHEPTVSHALTIARGYPAPPRSVSNATGVQALAGALVVLTVCLPNSTHASPRNVEVVRANAPIVAAWSPLRRQARMEMESYFGLSDGWDGNDSVGIPRQTIGDALAFLARLPSSVSEPSAGATEDGQAEWYWKSERGLATVSFRNGRMSYYARTHEQLVRGSETSNSMTLPQDLIDALKNI